MAIGHTGHADANQFTGENAGKWRSFVTRHGRKWELMNLDWAKNFHGKLLVVFYDELIENLEMKLRYTPYCIK
jgi:hypothetical protein